MKDILEQKIMKQVVRMYYLKKMFNPLMFKVYTLVIALAGVTSLVSIANVFRNMPSLLNIESVYTFISSAITNTEFSVQFVLGITVVVSLMLIKDTIKNLTNHPQLVTK